ncbi:MAG TPA: enoyl-CoA hydratase-related protein [Sphingobium sp.]|uniref:enoyl-CoA hydratase-related protein n=1 Tax=Sphingobium sp. TaxID=1912891 RepID=UPI002ED15A3F
MEEDYRFIRVSREGGVTTITLDRPDVLNALHSAMHFELHRAFDDFAADADQRIAVIRGKGRAFCVGSDLKADPRVMVSHAEKTERYPPSGYAGLIERFDLAKPVIAAVDGMALGGGFELALACDIIIATENARFGLPEPAVGAVALGGGVHRLARQIGLKQAMGMILSGEMVDAREGHRLGFVTEQVPAGALDAAVGRWTRILLGHSQLALMAAKETVMRGLDEPSLAAAIAGQEDHPAFARLLASNDVEEGPAAFVGKRPPLWEKG